MMAIKLLFALSMVLIALFPFQDKFMQWQAPMFKHISEMSSSPLVIKAFVLISKLATDYCYIVVMVLLYIAGSFNAIKHLLFRLSVGLCAISIFKQLFHAPRPYHYWEFMPARECAKGYGFPSGHMLASIPFLTQTFDLLQSYVKPEYKKFVILARKLFYFIYLPLLAFSRMYLGSHTLDQVIMGLVIGIVIAAICSRVPQESYKKIVLTLFIVQVSIAAITCYIEPNFEYFHKYTIMAVTKCPNSSIGNIISNSCWVDIGKSLFAAVYWMCCMPQYKGWKDGGVLLGFYRSKWFGCTAIMTMCLYYKIQAFYIKITIVYLCLLMISYGVFNHLIEKYGEKEEAKTIE
jgi:membrane-associated phospholipid phosphatase